MDIRGLEGVLSPRAAAINRRMELFVLFIGLTALPMLVLELATADGWLAVVAEVLGWLIWGLLFAEFVLVVTLTNRPRAYIRRAWLSLVIIVLALPPLFLLITAEPLWGALRVLRALALIALFIYSFVKLSTLLKHLLFEALAIARHPWMLAGRPLLKWHGLGLVTILFFALASTAGILHAVFEGNNPFEGLWWALVTLTTVGYGDIAPVTLGGRITAAVLMITGVGVLAAVTASIAARYVEGDHRKDLHRELLSIHERLNRIENLLSSPDPEKVPSPGESPQDP